MKIKVNDKVKVIAGKNKGQEGTITGFNKAKDRVYIDGVNLMKKHVKPSQTDPDGGISEVPGSIHISNVMLLDSKKNVTRVGFVFDAKGNKTRVAKTGNKI